LLVRDGGFHGTVICLHGALDQFELKNGSVIHAEAGVHCARLAKFAQQQRRAGLGFMAGIPGTVGGALAMNAGAWGAETWPNVIEAEVLLRSGRAEWWPASAFTYGYRHVELPPDVCGFLGARFQVSDDPDGAHERFTKDSLAKRKASQPVGKPSAGSTFRNPPGDHAARLIESCGLKGHRIGGAYVSPQHANFIITDPGAKAADVEALIHHIQRVVQDKTGVELRPEVRIVGEKA
ncbi:MAG: UDP-N-acetylmuramate dehydrogenase, partial [Hydrocarboniphaga effusa]|nr:UDP-N-acetylmuramate dehydrogenase [Hydrocarboniphaga effusa]